MYHFLFKVSHPPQPPSNTLSIHSSLPLQLILSQPPSLLFSHSVHPNLRTLFHSPSLFIHRLSPQLTSNANGPLMRPVWWCTLHSIGEERTNGVTGLQRHWATSVCVSEWKHMVVYVPHPDYTRFFYLKQPVSYWTSHQKTSLHTFLGISPQYPQVLMATFAVVEIPTIFEVSNTKKVIPVDDVPPVWEVKVQKPLHELSGKNFLSTMTT